MLPRTPTRDLLPGLTWQLTASDPRHRHPSHLLGPGLRQRRQPAPRQWLSSPLRMSPPRQQMPVQRPMRTPSAPCLHRLFRLHQGHRCRRTFHGSRRMLTSRLSPSQTTNRYRPMNPRSRMRPSRWRWRPLRSRCLTLHRSWNHRRVRFRCHLPVPRRQLRRRRPAIGTGHGWCSGGERVFRAWHRWHGERSSA